MRLVKVMVVFGFVCALLAHFPRLSSVQAKISPGPPLGMTGAPGEGTCIGCHYTYGGANSVPNLGPGRVQITGLPAYYMPGQTYAVTVTVIANESAVNRWGFELTVLDAQGSSATVGILTVTDAARVLKRSGSIQDQPRVYLSHNDEAGTNLGRSGTNSWSFTWTAPNSSAGEITFYATGNAADGQVTPEGDYIYATLATTKPPAPLITSQALTGLSTYLSAINATQVELRAYGNFSAGSKLIFNNVELLTQTTAEGLFTTITTSLLGSAEALPVRVKFSNGELSNTLNFIVAKEVRDQAVVAVDAASYALAVTPGQIVALFGTELTNVSGTASAVTLPLPRALQNTAIYVNGMAAPLFFASNGHINFQVPYRTAVGLATLLVLRADGTAAQGFVNVYPTAPALFAANASGKGQAAALNSDFTPNTATKRAQKGSFVILFGTGTGADLNNGSGQTFVPKDGEAATGDPLSVTNTNPVVTIGGVAAPVLFSGLTPGLAGLWQLNVQLPNTVPSGTNIEVNISLGGRIANRVMIAIE
jgi:uncharacterized protein (TIGR03437 family)